MPPTPPSSVHKCILTGKYSLKIHVLHAITVQVISLCFVVSFGTNNFYSTPYHVVNNVCILK